MSSRVSIVLGAAVLLTSAPVAMAQYNTPPASNQYIQANASAAVPQNAPVTNEDVTSQYLQANAAPAQPVENVPVAAQSPKKSYSGLWCDNSDVYGGHGPNTLWGRRTFWENQSSD